MKRNIPFNATVPILSMLLIAGIIAGYAWAETVELVTYYPTSANSGDQHVQSLTVGTAYQATTPPNGGAFIVGPVGIGTNAPTAGYTLDVVSPLGTNPRIYSRALDGNLTRLGLQNTDRHWSISNYGTQFPPNNGVFAIADETAAAVRLAITPAGFVGIGTLGPQGVFHVVGAPDAISNIIFSAGADNAGVAGVPRMRVGIETANPQAPLQVGASSLFVQDDQGGNIELGGTGAIANPVNGGMPYIDFHFGRAAGIPAQDFNTRLINRADGILDVQTSTGGAAAQTRLSVGNNIGVGTTTPQTTSPVANITSGNLDAYDIHLRSTGAWLSQGTPTATVTSQGNGTLTGAGITRTASFTINLPAGNWLLQAQAILHQDVWEPLAFWIDGVEIYRTQNFGDQAGTGYTSFFAVRQVAGDRIVTVQVRATSANGLRNFLAGNVRFMLIAIRV